MGARAQRFSAEQLVEYRLGARRQALARAELPDGGAYQLHLESVRARRRRCRRSCRAPASHQQIDQPRASWPAESAALRATQSWGTQR